MTPQSDDLPKSVNQKHNITYKEIIKQAYIYAGYRLRPADLEVFLDMYVRFGAYEQPVTTYCEGILSGVIKL